MLLWKKMADDLAIWCCTSATRDCKTVRGRFKHEGVSFLTITLPDFGKGIEKCLDQGRVDPALFTGFRFRGGLPVFLRGFLDLVFDQDTGVLLDDPSIEAIHAIRQLTLAFGKILLPCSDARTRKAMDGFIQCEYDIRANDRQLSDRDRSDFRRVSALLFAGAFAKVDREVYYNELLPKHGPGATADLLRGNAKYEQNTWPARLEEILPSGEFLLPNWRFFRELEAVDIVEPGQEIPVKVIPVPKTLKTPRIIAVEPTAMQYAQQAVLSSLLDAISRDDNLCHILGFTDQTPNQRMAREGSLYGNLATLDLSEASDRVSNEQVRDMLQPHPHLFKAVDACRSRKARVPGHGVIRLAKFASMGSALCFPFEAMAFATMIFIGIERELNTQLDAKTVKRFRHQVRIYGDDIIIPVDMVRSVVSSLSAFGAKVNLGKSFWNGKFRESCGREYYDGTDVSIVRVRRNFPTRRSDAQEVISLVSLRNQLYFAGLWGTVRWLDEEIGKLLKYFPMVLPTSPVLGRHSFLGFETQKLDKHLHSPLVKGYKVSAVLPKRSLDGTGALLKCLLMLERREKDFTPDQDVYGMPTVDSRHLERSGRPLAVNIKLGEGSSL
jgi:hypothetical protein